MRVEIRLKQICERHGLDTHGMVSRIAREASISRRIVEAFLQNKRRTIHMEHVERLCDWLRRHHVAADLPGALFGYRPSHLLSSLAQPGLARIYLGEYEQSGASQSRWVSRADAAVAAVFTELLSGSAARAAAADGGSLDAGDVAFPPHVEFVNSYVPSRVAPFGAGDGVASSDSTAVASAMFLEMRDAHHPGTNILIGSQRANHLVELFVADFFGGVPFEAGADRPPLFLHRPQDAPDEMRSCFGGSTLPGDIPGGNGKGIYYRVAPSEWRLCPHERESGADAGIVMVRRDPGTGHTEIAVFGYSGRATAALGDIIRRDPDAFWKDHERMAGGIEGRVYVCELSLREETDRHGGTRIVPRKDVRIRPLSIGGRARRRPSRRGRRAV